MAKKTKIRINLAEYDIVFLVLSKLMIDKPKMTLGEIKFCLLDEHAQGDFIDHQLTLKKAKWKHFLWSHIEPKERVKADVLQTVEGQLTCVAESLDPLQHFIEEFGEKTLAGDFEFVNKKTKNLKVKPLVKKTPIRKSVSKKTPVKKTPAKPVAAKKSAAKRALAKKAPVKKSAAKKSVAKKAPKKKK